MFGRQGHSTAIKQSYLSTAAHRKMCKKKEDEKKYVRQFRQSIVAVHKHK